MSGAKDKSLINMLLATVEDSRVNLKYGRQTRTDGESAFFDFSCDLTRAQSDELHEEVARLNSKLRGIDPEFIMTVHKALRTDVDTELEGEHHLGDILPRNALLFFLESCLDLIPTDAHEDVVLREVKAILPFCERYSNNCPRNPLQQAINNKPTASVTHANRSVESVAGQHGALLKHTSMNALMKKLGNATDIPYATSVFEQVASLHAVQYGITARAAAQSNEDIIALIDKILHSIESGNL
ncbi:hypothetical protein FVEG_06601 [Fusarium verticillioides 7600]|uniref:Uncharacterized protein n=1 Tax=Gibberella moniliformis (strain M3125 / FGSC 7600) TaxID=334819 RepID=W7M344_GIBM7|nr:hypothetical protein FVEG_06601 [Fusarium verticillioides 7600]EWG45973.1 hypothetical protein FVEG_06601 [Fusarium verticillioides 7600]